MDDREDGELSASDIDIEETVYNPVVRPEHPDVASYRNVAKSSISSDDDDSSSDSDFASLPKRQRTHTSQMEIERTDSTTVLNGARKRNNIWANVLQEEVLTQVIGGVGLKKLNSDRNVESYDYTQALQQHNKPLLESDEDGEFHEDEEKETLEDIQKRMRRKRCLKDRLSSKSCSSAFHRNSDSQRDLMNIEPDPSWTTEELGCAIADALFESKPELIVKVVEVLGKERSLNLYAKTQEVERSGGMMVLNGARRRTSGGVFLQLLKSHDGVEKSHLTQIFSEDSKASSQWRKRKRMNRRRRHDSKNQEKTEDDGLHLKGLFSDDPGGTKCPGSTPVTTPQGSDEEEQSDSPINRINGSHPLPLKEVCEKAALEISTRDDPKSESELSSEMLYQPPMVDEMDVV